MSVREGKAGDGSDIILWNCADSTEFKWNIDEDSGERTRMMKMSNIGWRWPVNGKFASSRVARCWGKGDTHKDAVQQ
eukprot:7346026-Pyramimonas_sp.AAC.1